MQSEHLLDMIQRILRSDQGYSQHAQISADWESESYWSALIIADFHQLIHNQFWSALINTMNNLSALIFLQIWPDQNWIIGRSKISDDQCADLAGVERRPLIHFWSGLIVYTFNADCRSYMIIPDSTDSTGNADNSINNTSRLPVLRTRFVTSSAPPNLPFPFSSPSLYSVLNSPSLAIRFSHSPTS